MQCRGMERCGLDRAVDFELRQSGTHFRCGLYGEGHGECTPWIPFSGGACIGDTARDGTGFARPCACDDAYGSVHRRGRGPLRIVQPFKNRLCGCVHMHHCAPSHAMEVINVGKSVLFYAFTPYVY